MTLLPKSEHSRWETASTSRMPKEAAGRNDVLLGMKKLELADPLPPLTNNRGVHRGAV
jgi:hypothetical protein